MMSNTGCLATGETRFTPHTLGEVIELKRGYDLPSKDRIKGQYPIISSSGISGSHSDYQVEGPGVVTGRYGTLGQIFYEKENFWPLNTTLYVKDFKGNHPKFIYYFLKTLDFLAFSDKAAVPGLNRNDLHTANILFPNDIYYQKSVASILGSLDDKIDINRRTNETLEAMARALFRDWFVDFGPTRAKMAGEAPYLAPELWELFPDSLDDEGKPEGWLYKSISSLGEVVCGKTPSTQNPLFYGDDVPFITIPDMHNKVFTYNTRRYLSTSGANSQYKKTLPPLSICVSCIATLGLVTLTKLPSQTNQQINSIIPSEEKNAFFIYETMRALSQEIYSQGSGGSVFFNLNTGKFKEINILLPTQDILDFFYKSVCSNFEKILDNDEQSQTLAQLRDLLLPKLMSGEISIRDAEKMVEDAA